MSLLSLTKGDWSSYVFTSTYHSHIVPLIIRACLLTHLSHARSQTTSSHLLSYRYYGRALRLSSKPIPPFVRSNSTTTPSNTLALSFSQPYSSPAHMHGCRSISLNTWGRSISLIHEVSSLLLHTYTSHCTSIVNWASLFPHHTLIVERCR